MARIKFYFARVKRSANVFRGYGARVELVLHDIDLRNPRYSLRSIEDQCTRIIYEKHWRSALPIRSVSPYSPL